MISYLFLFLFVARQDCTDAYLNKVLESQNYAHYFLVLRVKTGTSETEIVVLNYNLYNTLKSHDSSYADIVHYRDFIKTKIKTNEALNITERDLIDMQATTVTEDKVVEIAAAKGRNYFMNDYFNVYVSHNYARLRENISPKKNAAIVKHLFHWNYFIGINESNVEVSELNFCDVYVPHSP